jgi:ring-1,2-phenylacetyl-CoA epoxidase subunit PaaE
MAFNFFKKSEPAPKPDEPGKHYVYLTIKDIVRETKDSLCIVFAQPPEREIVYKSGQFLPLITTIQGKELRRTYSLCSSPFVDEDLAVLVKRVDDGLVSNHLVDNLKVGDKIKTGEPAGHFTTEYIKDRKRHIVMFAGGSGITPMMSHIKSTLSQEPDSVVSLIYCNRDEESIIFKEELLKREIQFQGRLHIIHILDQAPMNWQGMSGLLNHDMLKKLFERIPDWGIEKTTYLMCGPEGMMKNVETLLELQSIPKEKIFKETFVTPTIDKEQKKEAATVAAPGEKKAYEVTVRYDGQEHKFVVQPNRSILETALDKGIDLPYSCQSGLCTACRGKAISGKVKLDEEEGLSASERAEGYVLTCVGHPMSDDVVIEIG